MEPIVNYLEDAEKKLAKEMAELFSKMKEQRDSMSLQGIEEMYSIQPLEGIIYEPYLKIPMSLGPIKGHYYSTDFILPKNEYLVFKNETTHQAQNGQSWGAPTYICIALTNYGRCFVTHRVIEERNFPTNCFMGYNTYTPDTIRKLDPIPYKIPKQLFDTFLLAFKIGNFHIQSLHSSNTEVIKILSDTTASLQELDRDFYIFAGKWQPHMTACATVDVDIMRKTIIDNTQYIEELTGKEKILEQQNKSLEAELKQLKKQNASLEKEKAKLLPLEKYKDAVIDFMDNHYDINKKWLSQDIEYEDEDDEDGNEIPMDSSIIDFFKAFHSNKVFMDNWDYNDVLESKAELNEYRIYKKVKSEMVSGGMDNSSVARNVHSIKKGVNKLNS